MDDLQVIDIDPTTKRVVFTVKPRSLSGISKLVQIVVLSLLNGTGRDVLDPTKGGGLNDLIGYNINPKDSTALYAEISSRIKKSASEIIADQVGSSDLDTEKLRELQIVNITEGINSDEINVRIRVLNQAGQSSDIMV